MNNKIFALIDCNNFYASCERVFNPKLVNEPIVVLSNNDGCIVSRSNEVKKLGVPMGAPYFQYKKIIEENGVHVFSSNYTFYGDMSRRVMQSLRVLLPNIEIYSIDEAFVDLTQYRSSDLIEMSNEVKKTVKQWTGIPISIGIAHTKTLSKVANSIAKKEEKSNICDLREVEKIEAELATFEIEEIWGISKGWGTRLRSSGISTGLELMQADPEDVRKRISVVGQRIVMELNGYPCIHIEEPKRKKTIISSKSFGKKVTEIEDIKEAVSSYAARATEKLRNQGSKAYGISVYLRTSPFEKEENCYTSSRAKKFETPTSNTASIIAEANKIIDEIYCEGYRYQKTGITLLNLVNENYVQRSFNDKGLYDRGEKIMEVIDEINRYYGSNTIFHAAQGTKRKWGMKSDNRSKKYTTSLKELPLVK
ncbi:MAG: Y-family DNA polymerase [Candidatus Actinomarinales bacterium]|nr:MAG: Y-family DNA polymerase [Candidatus Actinomarinales bacterium]